MNTKRSVTELDREIGRRVRLRRGELGISQDALGAAIDVTFQQIQKYEHGVNRISASTLYRVAKALGASVLYFLPEEDAKVAVLDFTPESLDVARLYAETKDPLLRDAVFTLLKRAEKVAP